DGPAGGALHRRRLVVRRHLDGRLQRHRVRGPGRGYPRRRAPADSRRRMSASRPADAPPVRIGDASAPLPRTGDGRLPGDLPPRELVERILRVDHAGEYGARRIYDGQLAVLGKGSPAHGAIRAMAEQERRHLAAFDELVAARRVRPTALMPLWHV